MVPFQTHFLIPASQRLHEVKPPDPHFTIDGLREVGPWSKVTQAGTEAGFTLSPSDVHAHAASTAPGAKLRPGQVNDLAEHCTWAVEGKGY